jgi:hypothetical protein
MGRDVSEIMRGNGPVKKGKSTQAYLSLSDEEIAYTDRSLREGISMGDISRKLGFGTEIALRAALERRGFRRGNCLISIKEEEKSVSKLSVQDAEEREYLEVCEAFNGKRRATVSLVALLLRQLVKYCDLYVRDLPRSAVDK